MLLMPSLDAVAMAFFSCDIYQTLLANTVA